MVSHETSRSAALLLTFIVNGWTYGACFETLTSVQPNQLTNVRQRRWILVPRDELVKTKTVMRAAGKFKALTMSIKKPLYINIVSAGGLRAGNLSGQSDPYVLINAQSSVDRKAKRYVVQTSVIKKTLIPTWNQKLLLPGIDSTYRLTFTVIDFDFLSPDDFLGQAALAVSTFNHPLSYQNLQLPLEGIKYPPFESADGRIKKLSDQEHQGQGVVRIELIPTPASTSMAGYLQVCKQSENGGYSWWPNNDSYSRRWVALTGQHLYFYGSDNIVVDTISSSSISAIYDHANHFECVDSQDGTVWCFQMDVRTGSIIRQHQERKVWLEKLSLATGIDVITSTESQTQRLKSQTEIQTFGQTLLQSQLKCPLIG